MNAQVRHPDPVPGSCARMWAEADEPAWGSAAPAAFWVALEQPGPWGRKAFTESRLDPEVGRALESRCAAAGGRALLIRATGEHQLRREEHLPRRQVYVAGGAPSGRPWLLAGHVADPADLLDLPLDTLTGADPGPALAAIPTLTLTDSSALLVCTNARRDACCAVLGRPVALEAGTQRPGRVWECTHTGGHRFSPTAVVLPTGATLARLTTDLAVAAVDAAALGRIGTDLLHPRHHRGLAHLTPPRQAADAWVRHHTGEDRVDAVTITRLTDTPDGHDVDVTGPDGTPHHLTVTKTFDETRPRRNSCTTGPVPAESWHVTPRPGA